jgi:peptidoglycan/LPS O-acetylase OafA/YrhL
MNRKFDHLQILRAVAASLVIIDHGFEVCKSAGMQVEVFDLARQLAGHVGVSSFFILSGLIMTLQTRNQFGTWFNPLIFAYRRIVRIVPMYWIATFLWFSGLLRSHWPMVHLNRQLLLSLFFIPDYYFPGHDRMYPLLPHGWTLNYEMGFYLLFTLALFLPRRWGMAVLLLVPELLVALGQIIGISTGATPAAIPGFYMDPIVLVLTRGVLMGLIVIELKSLPKWKMPFSPALLLFLPTLAMLALPKSFGAVPLWGPLLSYSTVIVFLCLVVSQDGMGWVGRRLILLGDASYSTYLFHLFVNPYLIGWVMRLAGHYRGVLQMPLLVVAVDLILATILGVGVHLFVERPITHLIRKIPIGPPKAKAESIAVGA